MKGIKDIKLKRREEMIEALRKENEELKKQLVDEKALKEKQIEADSLIYQVKELRAKLQNEIKEFEAAKDEYLEQKKKFIKLNIEYKRKMDNFIKQLEAKKEGDT